MDSNDEKAQVVRRMATMTEDFRHAIQDTNLSWVGELLHQAWVLKRSVTDEISTGLIDDMYAKARRAGALGGKLLGAGGGGFLLVCAPVERHDEIRRSLAGHRCLPFQLDWTGTSIILYSPQDSGPDWASDRKGVSV
jgi:D-glycero-alpha-D-manno-heptose-7-phosphate kinase